MPGIFSADIYFLWAIDARNKKKNQKKKMEKWDYFEKFKNHLNPLPMDKILLGQSLNKSQEGFSDKSEAWKAAFPMHSI